jgi:hypothetical protein
MSVNRFNPRKFEDFDIIDGDDRVVGHIRVKPSGVLWAPSNAKVWYGSLSQTSPSSWSKTARDKTSSLADTGVVVHPEPIGKTRYAIRSTGFWVATPVGPS